MLVLSRKIGEAIQIADHIKVTVLSVQGGKVRLGIDAPRGVKVLRAEVPRYDDISGELAGLDKDELTCYRARVAAIR